MTILEITYPVALLTIIAYWHRDKLLYFISGLALILYASFYRTENIYLALVIFAVGGYTLIAKTFLEKK